MRVISEDQWEEEFVPVNEEAMPEFPEDAPLECVWTEVESGGDLAILAGTHVVNRIGYWVTEKPHSYDVEVEVITDGGKL